MKLVFIDFSKKLEFCAQFAYFHRFQNLKQCKQAHLHMEAQVFRTVDSQTFCKDHDASQ